MDSVSEVTQVLHGVEELAEGASRVSRGLLFKNMKHLRVVNATKTTLSFRVRFFSETTRGAMWLPEDEQFTDWYTIGPQRSYIPRLDQEHIMGMQAEIQIHPTSIQITGYQHKKFWLCRRPYRSPLIADYVFFLRAKGQKEPRAFKTAWIIARGGQTV